MKHSYSRRGAAVAVTLVTLLGVVLTPQAAVASDPVPICSGTADAPHISSGAGGVIAKGRYVCTPGVTQLFYAGYLYFCGSTRPVAPTSAGCSMVGSGGNAQSPPVPGRTYTQYMPDQPAKGLLLTGWYIASTNYAWQVGTATFTAYSQSPARYCAPFVQIQCTS